MTLVLWGRVLTDGQELQAARITVDEGRVTGVETGTTPDQADLRAPDDGWIAPGLIDLQVNGAGGVDLTSAAAMPDALERVATTLARHGVTAFCPTIVSSPLETITRALDSYKPARRERGAESLGAHVEGPFIDPAHRGVHEPSVLRMPSQSEIERWLEHATPAIVTLAPELPGALQAIEQLTQRGVTVSLGHSGANADQARAALDAGARMATHLFNGMPPLHHRAPGLVGALLASRATLGVIADGVHLDPLIVDLVVRRAGASRIALVSDMLAAADAPPGESLLGDQVVVSDGRVVRRRDGTLAGSAMLLPDCVRNVRAWLPDLAPAKLIDMASRTPATLLGARHKGRVAVGCDADLVLLEHDFRVRAVVLGGSVLDESRD